MTTFYCNDCGRGFNPESVNPTFPDSMGRCAECIHESGDCFRMEAVCYPCRDQHNEKVHGLSAYHTEPSIYCQACHLAGFIVRDPSRGLTVKEVPV